MVNCKSMLEAESLQAKLGECLPQQLENSAESLIRVGKNHCTQEKSSVKYPLPGEYRRLITLHLVSQCLYSCLLCQPLTQSWRSQAQCGIQRKSQMPYLPFILQVSEPEPVLNSGKGRSEEMCEQTLDFHHTDLLNTFKKWKSAITSRCVWKIHRVCPR